MKQRFFILLALGIPLCCQPVCVAHAQQLQSSEWAQFVNSDQNVLQKDTFRLQTFRRSTMDNWEYTLSGEVTERIFPTTETGLREELAGLQINLPGSVEFAPYHLEPYRNVHIRIQYGGGHLQQGNDLKASIVRDGQRIEPVLNSVKSEKDFLSFLFQEVSKNPSYLKIYTDKADNPDGYYGLLMACAIGDIPTFSRYTGSGCWNDTIRWSHLPAARHRTALIEGTVTVTGKTLCDDVRLRGSRLVLGEGAGLEVMDLSLYGTENSISGKGKLHIGNELCLYYSFPEKGKWYFVAFPVDIYADEISPDFTLKDDRPNEGGNYFYVRTYNGARRAEQNKASGNWEVQPAVSGHTLLFERGKGYLIALDAEATKQEICFTSGVAEDNSALLQAGTQEVSFVVPRTGENASNYGWVLCGNPFPSPLHFSQIEVSGLDREVYVYSGGAYQPFNLDMDREIPPYCPFFMKAGRQQASVSFRVAATSQPSAREVACSNLYEGGAEPEIRLEPTANEGVVSPSVVQLVGNRCYVNCMSDKGLCRIYSAGGQLVYEHVLCNGLNDFVLDLPSGCYLVEVSAKEAGTVRTKVYQR